MVSVLAFDSTGSGCSAALLRDGRILAHRFAAMARGQTERLMPMIAEVVEEARTPIETLDLIGVTVGPGAFTGLRIGLAAAHGLSLASGVPAIGITSFAAVAAQIAPEERRDRRLVVALDSKRAELYLQAFGTDGAAQGDGALVGPADFAAWVPPGPLLLAGDGAARLAQAITDRRPVIAPGLGIPDAADVARLAAASWRRGQTPPRPRPLYLRPPDTTMPSRPGQGAEKRAAEAGR